MRILAIETATEACSVALFGDGELIDGRHELLGRGHAERLVPLIADLPDHGKADRILVSLGPGSFTGSRIGLAAARALGLAWQVPVLGFPTLALVAAQARATTGAGELTVCMTRGHGEWFVQDYGADGLPQGSVTSLPPETAVERGAHTLIVGSKADEFAEALAQAQRPTGDAQNMLPDARYALSLPESLLTTRLTPLYGRAPDAKLPGQ